MEPYPSFTEIPHIVLMSGMTAPASEAYDPSLPAEHPLMTRVSRFQCHPPLDQSKSREASLAPQAWWNGDEANSTRSYLPDYNVYPEPFSPWNSGVSTNSNPQSPRSSNSGSASRMSCIVSPSFRHEDIPITGVGEQGGYPAPDSLVDIDRSVMIPKPPVFEVQPDHLSPYEHDFEHRGSSQSDCNMTPEQQWSSPLPDPTACPQPARRSKARPNSAPRIRKTNKPRPTSASGRNRRRRVVTGENNGDNATPRTFVCSFAPYGCESTFVSKNEWKRHLTSQHLQLGFYRCDVGKCNIRTHQGSPSRCLTPSPSPKSTSSNPAPGQPNDFNRKDLFTQHQRRMHAPWLQSGRRRKPTDTEHAAFEESLEQVRQRSWHSLRHPPQQSHCGFCRELFTGEGSWDARMEHVGRHFEREDRANLGEELEDLSLRDWGLREGVLTLADGKCLLASLARVEL